MVRQLHFAGILVFCFAFNVVPFVCYKCVHDEVANTNVSLSQNSDSERERRDVDDSPFVPLSIHTYIDEIDHSFPDRSMNHIKIALQTVISMLQSTLKVKQTVNPFVLDRLNCMKRFETGRNKGRCSKLKSVLEFCNLKSTEYLIPDVFLSELNVYNFHEEKPYLKIKGGPGVKDKNFILFVISRTTSWCSQEGVQAYGSFCRLDDYKRPIAGLLNLCPQTFARKLFKIEHYYNVILHELIHILGFSHHLFKEFMTCSEYDCLRPKKIFDRDSNGIQRIVLPEVVEAMQSHSNCSEDEFGAPLAVSEEFGSNNSVASHWHPLLMYSSIMSVSILEGEKVVLDNMTLALLSSTGWYKVDFNVAENFQMGIGEGCNFGIGNNCEKFVQLCDPKKDTTGCDVSQHNIGKCESIVSYHPCGVYKPTMNGSCEEDKSESIKIGFETFEYKQLCVTLEQKEERVPRCAVSKCRSKNIMEFYLNSSWIGCPFSEKVQLDENSTIICPRLHSFCSDQKLDLNITYSDTCPNLAISVRMYFTNPSFEILSQYNSFKQFQVRTLNAIARDLKIPSNYIHNATLVVYKNIYLEFKVCPPGRVSQQELVVISEKLQHFLKHPFASVMTMSRDYPVISSIITMEPESAVEFSDYQGLRMLLIVPVTCAIFVIASLVATVVRSVRIQMQRPKREIVEMESKSLSNFGIEPSNQALLT